MMTVFSVTVLGKIICKMIWNQNQNYLHRPIKLRQIKQHRIHVLNHAVLQRAKM